MSAPGRALEAHVEKCASAGARLRGYVGAVVEMLEADHICDKAGLAGGCGVCRHMERLAGAIREYDEETGRVPAVVQR